MKTYIESTYRAGEYIDVPVNVPTPKELQASTKNDEFSVVITNFSMPGREPNFAVARFDKTTDEVLIKMGFLFETVAKAGNVYSFKGKNARRDAIGAARDMLIGRY